MKSETDDTDETSVRQLFDASADEPSGPVLTKLAARAGEIPSSPRRVPSWFPRWAWAPSAAGLAAAAGALAVTLASWFGEPEGELGPATATPAVVPAVALAPVPTPAQPESKDGPIEPRQAATAAPDSDERALGTEPLAAELSAESALDSELDALYGPPADADLDAWLHATSELLHVHDG
ncbi:MAG TPA: hypothetical protein VI072_21825 [Polyangiaceae bacterium]